MENKHTPVPGKSLAMMLQEASELEEQILILAESNGGEVDAMLDQYLSTVSAQIETKADNYKFILDRLEVSGEMLKEQGKKFYAASATLSYARDRLKDRMKEAMLLVGKPEIKGVNWRWKLSPIAAKIEVTGKVAREFYSEKDLLIAFNAPTLDSFMDVVREHADKELLGHIEMLLDLAQLQGKLDKDKVLKAVESGATVAGVETKPNYRLASFVNKGD